MLCPIGDVVHENIFFFHHQNSRRRTFFCRATLNIGPLYSTVLDTWREAHFPPPVKNADVLSLLRPLWCTKTSTGFSRTSLPPLPLFFRPCPGSKFIFLKLLITLAGEQLQRMHWNLPRSFVNSTQEHRTFPMHPVPNYSHLCHRKSECCWALCAISTAWITAASSTRHTTHQDSSKQPKAVKIHPPPAWASKLYSFATEGESSRRLGLQGPKIFPISSHWRGMPRQSYLRILGFTFLSPWSMPS